jgi:hypothetical protein
MDASSSSMLRILHVLHVKQFGQSQLCLSYQQNKPFPLAQADGDIEYVFWKPW